MSTKLILILFAGVCNAGMILFATNARTGHEVAIEFDANDPADPSVHDLGKKLLDFPAEASGLPKDFITADGISISYAGRALEQSAILSEQGVCSEARILFEPKVHQITAHVQSSKGAQTGRAVEWIYNIPVGCPDLMHEMMEQTEAQWRSSRGTTANISDRVHQIRFSFNFNYSDQAEETIDERNRKIRYAESAAVVKKIEEYHGEMWFNNCITIVREFGDRIRHSESVNIYMHVNGVAFVFEA